ncbi:hypothetical protein F5148DRAFT_564901 [Russula earlei]|uniref:Uncharacterized protein n=1 Tax=Russula earlei TaxID=71964 RepID=A0ACC0UPJ7_9AGAM|nr:hypothetical protein F5148DRAFT_564901 [Russula earlei]
MQLLERVYSYVSLVQVVISRSSNCVRGRDFALSPAYQRPRTFQGLGPLGGSKPPVAANTLPDTALSALPRPPSDRDLVVTATESAHNNLDVNSSQKRCALCVRRGLPAATVFVPPRYPTTTPVTIPSSFPNVAPTAEEARQIAAHTISLPPIISPPHTLRRKHHMTIPRQKSTRSLRSWAPTLSSPQPVPVSSVVRLGHPSRPYYTAIRPHLNNGAISPPPATPTTLFSPPPTLTDRGPSLPSPPPGRPSFEFTRPRSSTTSGWSLSGEIELQIELSQRREEGEEIVMGHNSRRGSIARGVRKLGTGLRDLVLRRS